MDLAGGGSGDADYRREEVLGMTMGIMGTGTGEFCVVLDNVNRVASWTRSEAMIDGFL